MPTYLCPECEAVLKRSTPIPDGKKIKCPKCEFVFKATPMREADEEEEPVKKPVKAAKKSIPEAKKSMPEDEDDDAIGGSYSLADEKEDTAKEKKDKDVNYGSLRDKYEKSKRGPAMAKIVTLSNRMLLIGIVTAVFALVGVIGSLWPFIFSDDPPKGRDARFQIFYVLGGVFAMVYGGCICYGGSKLHDLESYGWAMTGAIMTAIMGLGNALSGFLGVAATMLMMGSDPKPVEAPAMEAGAKTIQGKVLSSDLKEFVLQHGDKKQMTFKLGQDVKFLKKAAAPAKPRDFRDGATVKVIYMPEGEQGVAKTVVIDPSDGEEDNSFMQMIMMLVYLLVLGWGAFACSIGGKVLMRMREDDVKEGFEETTTARDY